MKIAILGCGWLGFDLGKVLKTYHHEVRGSVTRMEKMTELRAEGIIPYSLKLYEKGIQGDMRSFLSKTDVIVIDIPPGLRKNPEGNFVKKIRNLIPYIEKSNCHKVIFVSSTSVYKDKKSFPVYTEESETDTSSNVATQLRKTELLLLDNEKFNTSVVRFGGLIGRDRHPVTYLAGRQDVKSPEAPINLVHREDCIDAVMKLIDLKDDNSVWNLVAPEHPSKHDYYTKVARLRELEPPQFDTQKTSKGKEISSEKIISELKFEFKRSIY